MWPPLIGLMCDKNYSDLAVNLSRTQKLVMKDSLKIENLFKNSKIYHMPSHPAVLLETLKNACVPKKGESGQPVDVFREKSKVEYRKSRLLFCQVNTFHVEQFAHPESRQEEN